MSLHINAYYVTDRASGKDKQGEKTKIDISFRIALQEHLHEHHRFVHASSKTRALS